MKFVIYVFHYAITIEIWPSAQRILDANIADCVYLAFLWNNVINLKNDTLTLHKRCSLASFNFT